MLHREVPTDRPIHVDLSHFVLRTARLDDTIEFYGRLLGMKCQFRGDGGAALSHDGEHHRIALAAVPPAEPGAANPMAPGLEHVAFKLRNLADLLGNYERVKRLGMLPFMTIHHGGTLSAYYLDPDGVQVETFIDTMIRDEAIEVMHSERFKKNPIGVPVDFDDLVARFGAGEPMADLLAQPDQREGDLETLIAKVRAARGI